ncbi:MAG: fused MFS/spermidine synthase [Thermodesulfobacteriota bacterium]|nr:fused MFS/spermidine synthase [Thermodesulfobacteriota bacterium]
MKTILCIIFFFSGASALIFELLWFQLSGLTFGNSVWATSIVLSTFMAGLALGSGLSALWGHKVKSPVCLYALLEIAIAVSGFGLVLLFPDLTRFFVPLFRAFSEQPFIVNSLRAFIAFVLMLIPATAMGATLPILVKALYAKHANFGRVLGVLYGWNTLGAMAGVMTSEIFFVNWFGIRGAGLVAASFNLFAAFMALWLSKTASIVGGPALKAERFPLFPAFPSKVVRLLLASFLSGFTVLALEVIWFRFLLLFYIPHSWNFAVMLAMVLSGISLGGLFASTWFKWRPDAHRLLAPILLANGILVSILYGNVAFPLDLFKALHGDVSICLVSLFLIFPVCFVSGIVFTMLGKALHEEMGVETRATGLLTLANTFGGMLGSLSAGLAFIPSIGIEKAFFLLAFSYGIITLLVSDTKALVLLKGKFGLSHLVAGFFVISLILFPFGLMDLHFLETSCARYLEGTGERRVAFREGLTETIQYLQRDLLGKPDYHRLLTNSYSMSGTTLTSKRYMKVFVYWPVAMQSDPKSALLVCYGVGSTAKALTDTEDLEHIDVVDISRDIVEMSDVIYGDSVENPVNDPRVEIHIEDGRYFLLTTKRRFDLITGEPPPPKLNGIVNLYSQEYFQLIHDRLSEGGVVTYWLPVYQLKVSETKAILKGFCNVFQDCSLWSGSGFEWMMVGIKNPKTPVPESDFVRQWNDPVVGPEMRALGLESPEQFGSLFIADRERLQNWVSDTLPLVDNHPRRLSYEDVELEEHLPVYRDFMDHGASQESFMRSQAMAKLWPPSVRKKAKAYFPVRQAINEMLSLKIMRNTNPLMNLHLCIQNPLLEGYILWAFGSDQHAQTIISEVLGKNPQRSFDTPEVYDHLAAGAAQERDYVMAEKYLGLAADRLEPENPLAEHLYYAVFRMYLLSVAGDKERAIEVGGKYIALKEEDKENRRKQIEQYWKWIVYNSQQGASS